MRSVLFSLFYMSALLALAFAVLRVVDRLRARTRKDSRTPEEMAAEEFAYRSRLLNPRWEEVVRVTGGHPSASLLTLYADRELLQRTNFSVSPQASAEDGAEEFIARFQPADGETLTDEWYPHLPAGSFPFAQDVTGDLIFVQLAASGADSPVMHWHHDGGDIEQVASSLEAFRQACIESAQAAAHKVPPN